MSREIDHRITTGWIRFGEYSHFFKDSKISVCLKRNGHSHLISYDVRLTDMDHYKR